VHWLRHFEGGQFLQRRRVEELNHVSVASQRQNPSVGTVTGLAKPPCGVLRELCLKIPARYSINAAMVAAVDHQSRSGRIECRLRRSIHIDFPELARLGVPDPQFILGPASTQAPSSIGTGYGESN